MFRAVPLAMAPSPTRVPRVALVAGLARHGARTALLTGDGALTCAEFGERVRDRAAALGATRRLVMVTGGNDLVTLVSHLGALTGRCSPGSPDSDCPSPSGSPRRCPRASPPGGARRGWRAPSRRRNPPAARHDGRAPAAGAPRPAATAPPRGQAVAIGTSVGLFGLALGVLARETGLSPAQAEALSVLVFAGSTSRRRSPPPRPTEHVDPRWEWGTDARARPCWPPCSRPAARSSPLIVAMATTALARLVAG